MDEDGPGGGRGYSIGHGPICPTPRWAFMSAWSVLHPDVRLDAEVVVMRFERVEV